MRAVRTQFDAGEFSGTVATPTCCCSCCCCCCVTTAATASIVGAGAAVVAGRHRGLPWWGICCGLLLGLIAPWLLIGPILLSFVIPGYGGEIIPLLAFGILLTWAAYQALGAVLRPHARFRAGTGFMIVVYLIGFIELLFVGAGIANAMDAKAVFLMYLGFAAVVAVVAGAWMLLLRSRKGQTFVEEIAGVPPRRQEEKSAGGGVS
ncbi:MAG: hypothetical protein Q4D96_13740 [Propionibacteriaceae bacterium]|nr:hypothetical protein [Propionibacteriaceae bacterium]